MLLLFNFMGHDLVVIYLSFCYQNNLQLQMLELEDTLPPPEHRAFCSQSHPRALRFVSPWLWPRGFYPILPGNPSSLVFLVLGILPKYLLVLVSISEVKHSNFFFYVVYTLKFNYVSREISVNMVKSQLRLQTPLDWM